MLFVRVGNRSSTRPVPLGGRNRRTSAAIRSPIPDLSLIHNAFAVIGKKAHNIPALVFFPPSLQIHGLTVTSRRFRVLSFVSYFRPPPFPQPIEVQPSPPPRWLLSPVLMKVRASRVGTMQ